MQSERSEAKATTKPKQKSWSGSQSGRQCEAKLAQGGAIEVPSEHRVPVRAGAHGDNERLGLVEHRRLVRLQLPHLGERGANEGQHTKQRMTRHTNKEQAHKQ